MTPAECAEYLRQYNAWRRGDDSFPQPVPKALGQIIDAAIAHLEAMGWQTIDTAPKDGSSIMLYTAEGQIEGYFSCGDWQQAPCYATYDGCGGVALICQPTHWKPLPPAPKGKL